MAAEVLTAKEAAEFLQVSESTVKARARAGDIPGAKVGRKWRFLKADLEHWLRSGGSAYEDMVSRGMLLVMEERKHEPTIPWEKVKAELGL
jgi:excisionase family DNA binding protein